MADPVLTESEQAYAAAFDAMHAARARSTITSRLYARAMGDAQPAELDASSSADWPLLGTMIGALRMNQGDRLVDLGCGTGGVGLWLARAFGVCVTGIDVSGEAVQLATDSVHDFSLSQERAAFKVGSRAATGLPDEYAHGLICVDALGSGRDRSGTLREVRRVLKPGGRAVVTSNRSRVAPSLAPWARQAEEAGLLLEAEQERPHEPGMWRRLFELWIEYEDELRQELGHEQAEGMLAEAEARTPFLAQRLAAVVTLRRPSA
ncbi:class I SAM-dependent methyltransferase [Streptomyces andamanensis]|uniref:Class I SAM-dependent methyltransferase n=1 Tax=Streptomyces andamanensis TaxID=1565035 RepID=A0ABV8TJQ7_9ACTN